MLDENCAHALREAREKAERERFARNQVAFPDPKGAEGVARDLDVRFLGGLVIHELETALLQSAPTPFPPRDRSPARRNAVR